MQALRPEISVIVPHLNQPQALAACLARLADQSIDPARYEVVVVDNGSAHLPHEALAACANARIISEPAPGPGPARNAGVRAANGRMLAFIDADCRAARDWLAVIVRELRAAPDTTILGGDVRIWRDIQSRYTAIEAYESVFAYRSKLYIEKHGYCPTGNLAFKRRTFDAIGPFAGIEIAEDMDWGERARRAGFRIVYIPDMIIFHPARQSMDELYAKWDRHLQHYLNMARGRPGWRTKWALRATMIMASPALNFVQVLTSNRVHGVRTRLNAIVVLFRIRMHRGLKMIALLISDGHVSWNRSPAPNRLIG